jgi:DNA-binding response OmpR family regulator
MKMSNGRSPSHDYSEMKSESVQVGDVLLDVAGYVVRVRERVIPLAHKELRLLQVLMTNQGRVMPRDTLLREVWGDQDTTSQTLDVHISRLRRKLDLDPRERSKIRTVRGLGYVFDH